MSETNSESEVIYQPYSNAGLITSIRYWLINILAGKAVIILNAKISCGEAQDDCIAEVKDIDGLMFCRNSLCVKDGKWISIRQMKRRMER